MPGVYRISRARCQTITLLGLFAIFCTTNLAAQPAGTRIAMDTSVTREWYFGVSGGITRSDFHGSQANLASCTSRISFQTGIISRFALSGTFGVHGGLYYNRRGAERVSSFDTRMYRLDYIEVTPIFHVRVPLDEQVTPYFGVGPTFAWNINALVDITHGEIRETLELTDIRKFDPGFVVVCGLEITVASFLIITEFGYTYFPASIQSGTDPAIKLGNHGLHTRAAILF
jgi:hypothetical protein